MKKSYTRILLTHRFYFPDSPTYGHILENMRKNLQNEGYQVDVLTTKPSYRISDRKKSKKFIELTPDGSKIYRLPVFRVKYSKIQKIVNYFWFPFSAFLFQLFSKRYDIVSTATTPPVLYAFSTALACRIRQRKLIYHIMDIHPEIGRLSGEFKNKLIYKVLLYMDNYTCQTASSIIVLSKDMQEVLINRNPNLTHKIDIVNNYDVNNDDHMANDFFIDENHTIKVVFAGNIGRFQNLESFILALIKFGEIKNFELIFVGEGTALKKLKELALPLKNNVRFIPHQTMSTAREIMSQADMGIVSLENEIIKYAYPSKTMTYLAEGTPILVSTNSYSELSKFVKSEKVGIALEPSDLHTIHQTFSSLANGDLSFDSSHVKEIFNQNFSKQTFDKKFLQLVKKIMETS